MSDATPHDAHDPHRQRRADPYAALRHRDFRLLALGRLIATLGDQMLAVAIGWQLYERTHAALALGLVGLIEGAPVIALALPAGHLADNLDRKRIASLAQAALVVCALALALLSATRGPLPLIYLTLLVIGMATGFSTPANSALLPQTVPEDDFANAATWSSSSWQISAVLGPALGGALIALRGSATAVYALDALAYAVTLALLALLRTRPVAREREAMTLRSLIGGVEFVRRDTVMLAAITLDLFAVLLGGATTLLPVYAEDILHVGAVGLGWLRAAPSVGAVLMALALTRLPPFTRAGRTLLLAVAGFGVATVIFGVSRSFALSLAMLALLGALDNISVVIRSTLLMVRAPDAMRGRVSAVSGVFISMSNEIGGFESGLAASLFGPTLAVAAGGVGTVLVVSAVALIWPEIRRLGRIGLGARAEEPTPPRVQEIEEALPGAGLGE